MSQENNMEIGEGGCVPMNTPRRRISWSKSLVESLLQVSVEAEPTKRGYHSRLVEYWNLAHPTQPSTSAALLARLARAKTDGLDQVTSANNELGDEEEELDMEIDPPVSSEESLREMIEETLHDIKKVGPSSLASRPKLFGRWRQRDKTTLDRIDEVISQKCSEAEADDLWCLNCLIYTGAQVALQVAAKVKEGPTNTESEGEGDDDDESDTDSDSDSDGDSDEESISDLPTEEHNNATMPEAYDLVPRKWINSMLRAMRAPMVVRRTIRKLIPLWETCISLKTPNGPVTAAIPLRRGLFQGDALSPLLFCLCVAPLSLKLRQRKGFKSRFQSSPVTHLMFMDDLKIYEESQQELRETIGVVERVSTDVGMQLGVKKCAVAHAKAGKVVLGGGVPLNTGGTISEVPYGDTYKYLGINQLFGTNLTKTKAKIKNEFLKRIRKTWQANLNSLNKVKSNNSWAAAVLRYFYAIVRWSKWDMLKLDRQARAIMKQQQSLHANSSIERLYLPRSEGGRGLTSVELAWEQEAISCTLYLLKTEDLQVRGAMRFQIKLREMNFHSLLDVPNYVAEKYELDIDFELPLNLDRSASQIKRDLREQQREVLRVKLEKKTIHGVFAREAAKPGVNQKLSFRWLKDGRLQSQTEALIIAAQDGVIHTAAYQTRVLKTRTQEMCRACDKHPETIGHIVACCDQYKWTLRKECHDRVLFQLVKAVALKLGLEIPKALQAPGGVIRCGVMGTKQKRLLIDQCIPTNRTIKERRPDLIVRLEKEKKVFIFEVAVAWDPLLKEREKQKRDKYEELAADLARQWPGFRIKTAAIVVGDLGLVTGLKRNLEATNLLDNSNIDNLIGSIQREALCGTVRIGTWQ